MMNQTPNNQPTLIDKFKLWWQGDLDLSEHLQDGDKVVPPKILNPVMNMTPI